MTVNPADVAALLDEQARARARDDLIAFACYVDPQQAKWYRAEHLQRIAKVLERVERGELKRVIINVPPRHWKSSITSEKFTAWYLGRHPTHAVILASAALNLATKFSKSVRDTITGDKYKRLFSIAIKRDSNTIDDWLLETGYRSSFRTVGTGGTISGHGARLVILDDVSDPNKVNSDTETEGAWYWYKNVILTRAEGSIVIVNNRVGANDLTGFLLDAERNDSGTPAQDWEVVNIQAEKEGKFLWEERFGNEYYQKLQGDPFLWAIQYQQETASKQGTEIRREWFEFVPSLPQGSREQCRAWDTALTVKQTEKADPDYTASVGSTMVGGWLYLLTPMKFRAETADVINRIRDYKKLYPYVRMASGHAFSDNSARKGLVAEGIALEEYDEKIDIKARCATFVSWASRGLIKLVCAPEEYEKLRIAKAKGEDYTPPTWRAFMEEITSAFHGKHDDLLAACAGITQMHGLVISNPVPQPKRPTPSFDMQIMPTSKAAL